MNKCETERGSEGGFWCRVRVAEDIWGHLDLWEVRGLERVVWRGCGGIWTLTAAIKGAQRGRGGG